MVSMGRVTPPRQSQDAGREKVHLELDLLQVLAAAAAGVAAAFVSSTFGVGGTIAGAGLGSAVATVTAAAVREVLEHGRSRLSAVRPAALRPLRLPAALRRRGAVMAAGIALAFLVAIAAITAIEVALARPISSLFGAGPRSGTSIGTLVSGTPRPSPTPQPAGTPRSVPPSSSPTAPTSTRPATPEPTPAPSPRPSSGPSSPPIPPPSAAPTP
jgi:hypothetical protein